MAGKNSPEKSWATCTPDCLIPNQPLRCAGGTSRMRMPLVVGLQIANGGPASTEATKSIQ